MTSNDRGSSGAGGSLSDIDILDIQVAPHTPDIAAYTINGFTRPALDLDPSGHIILDQTALDFASTYGIRALYLGGPESTPYPPVGIRGSVSAVIAGDDERSAAALPLRSQDGFGDRVRSSQSYSTGA